MFLKFSFWEFIIVLYIGDRKIIEYRIKSKYDNEFKIKLLYLKNVFILFSNSF